MNINFEKLFLLESITNHTPLGLIFISPEKKIDFINKKAKSFLHNKCKSVETIDIFSFFPQLNALIDNFFSKKDNKKDVLVTSLNGNKYNLDICPIYNKDIFMGWLLILKDLKEIINTVNKYSNQEAAYTFNDIIGESSQLKKVLKDAELIAKSPSTVLITGESGCGKELLAQSIHNASNVSNGPFVALNCGAIPKTLIESELFGYEEASFTGSKKGGKPGKFELADGGTIFLDEICEMPIEMQVTLLRVIQEGVVTRIGGKTQIPINVRIIAATNKVLKEEIKKGTFREDLYYRLNVMPLHLPPLKDRLGDIPILIDYFLNIKSQKLHKEIPHISQKLYKKMISYCWPGNIRELENCVENIVNLNGSTSYEINFDECHCLKTDNLGNPIKISTSNSSENYDEDSVKPLIILEKEAIEKALCVFDGNITKASNALGISRNALYNKMKRYGINN
ncbi:sigma-54 interaction domain-containing protein [Clostridium baratii]|uniref:sigma-54 interaction domain-containing protein n=1 Tax=Clostridium baratii TaxID=1561 RepID=UPI000A4393AC|nr:sigma 54-interacting transcriptional regulator [Clostridium baratii]STB00550.1 sigma-54 dependent transcriptional regulator [Clostridium baratii]